MRLIVDTHILLWALIDDDRLPDAAASLLSDPSIEVFASVVNIWEVAIKFMLNRGRDGDMPISADTLIELASEATYSFLPVEAQHAAAVGRLPPVHGDPFDRLLVAQAAAEGMRLLTHEKRLKEYGLAVLRV